MRDPWAGPFTHAWREMPAYRSRIARWMGQWLERLVLTSATGAVCNTREFAAALAERYPLLEVEWIPNGVDREVLPRVVSADRFPGLGLAHVGTIYGGRSLSPVLRGLRAFLDCHATAATDGTRLRIAGHVDDPYHSAILRELGELRLEPWVELLGVLPRAEAMSVVARSRLAIVLAQDQEFQVPAKLYELAAMGVPTVVVATPESAAGSEARRLGTALIAPADTDGLVAVMARAWKDQLTVGGSPDGETDYSRIASRVNSLLSDM
ncbi:MAG TPA: glycosyltransferase, partial [Gemmatimonadales bacterium]|nr:glycosyltransferase [Gemmatimonadales bacterium]